MNKLLDYFKGDELAADVWLNKYAVKDEETPDDMHIRMAREFSRIEENYGEPNTNQWNRLSYFGRHMHVLDTATILGYFSGFRYIVPQGSIMTMLGNKYKIGSLSNCFVIPPPIDSYGGILRTDQQLVQLMKRRGGVGTNLNTLRPSNTPVSNAAGSSTGSASFMHRYSNSTREVAQNGRRGALMLLLSCKHPDIFKFVNAKKDRTQITGANISAMLTDKFMQAVEKDGDFYCTFPIENADAMTTSFLIGEPSPYNQLCELVYPGGKGWVMRIKAKELFDMIVDNAWENAEPGVAFIDRILEYCPEGVYPQYVPIASNPCGEQWMQAYDACRLLALNLFSIVTDPFTEDADIDWNKLYEIAYIQQRLADDIVDLEIEYVQKIIAKINSDPEPSDIKLEEMNLWLNVLSTAKKSRRTGCGLTALGDMLAALNVKYDSTEGLVIIEKVMKKKMEAELDCTIDLAITRGTFEGYEAMFEYEYTLTTKETKLGKGRNAFYDMLVKEFPEQAIRMARWGRRNVSWSTVAPTGTVSLMTQTTSGLEPLFLPFYMRKKKVNAGEDGVRVDFIDQNLDCWQEYPVLHPKFKDWIEYNKLFRHGIGVDQLDKATIQKYYEESPWYKSTANDISWDSRIEAQAIIQKYTTNAISSTINLPENVAKETIAGIYMAAWKAGLKGVTVYRDNCRSGVLTAETSKKSSFEYSDAVKRPKELDADLHVVTAKGIKYGVIIGHIEGKPYEIFAFNLPDDVKHSTKGKVVKMKKGHYNFVSEDGILRNIQEAAVRQDEQMLTRMVSGMLRHGAKPQFVMEQIDKCDMEIVSFSKAVSRTLKKYVNEADMVARNKCSDCGSTNLRMQEGCLTCNDCGSSKCG